MKSKLEELINKIESSLKKEEIDKIREAYNYALSQALGKKRLNGDDYILHPLNVALILTDLNIDCDCICAALLHETINHGTSTYEEIKNLFGEEIASLVLSISKINRLELSDDSNASSLYLRKVLVGLAKDVRVLFIKIADRIHNLRTGYALPPEKLKEKIDETMNVLIPIAHRLGMYAWKTEMEDWCLKYSKPDVYDDIVNKLSLSRNELEDNLEEMQESISEILIEHNISFEIKSRVKSIYSIYNKLNNGKKWNQIYDILALRIIVNKVSECYLAIGLIHAKYRPIPGRFKDYIAMPKENMYQSLHTGVFGSDGYRYEIQIRTHEMDEIAEKGIASHWSYKEKGSKNIHDIMEQKLEMFRSLIEASDNTNLEEFDNQVKNDFLNECIYVFTPKGDVVELPFGSTPLDFAYRIHSGVGDTTVGAIVNDNIVNLEYTLQNNDIVEIKTNPNSVPKKEWLNYVKTSHAKNKIKSYFNKNAKESIIEKGKSLMQNELRKRHISFDEVLNQNSLKNVFKELHLNDINELYFAIGSLRYTSAYIIDLVTNERKSASDALIEKIIKNNPKNANQGKNDILVSGTNDILVSIASCCKPVFGDEIVGYITKGNGIKVHLKTCENIKRETSRLIEVSWNNEGLGNYEAKLIIKACKECLLEIVSKATVKSVNVVNIETKNEDTNIKYNLTLKVKNSSQLEDFISELKGISDILEVRRK